MNSDYKPIKIKLDVYQKLKQLKVQWNARSISEVIKQLIQAHELPAGELYKIIKGSLEEYMKQKVTESIKIKMDDLQKAMSATDTPTVVSGSDYYIIVTSSKDTILDANGNPARIAYSVVILNDTRRIYIVGKDLLLDRLLFFVSDNKAIGIKFLDQAKKVFIGEMSP